ncbi:hypothetical protein BOX15_Mlig032752g4 [Macrostomum lignano]|uniref:Uncharacterized protein n=1 Tax=Macrostomum lignano TaxID=282301 RepID=A0A267G683_9PLAT|nr:hypothetical protein BOX15_Mlig032752g4 [Macrostomum lignano]
MSRLASAASASDSTVDATKPLWTEPERINGAGGGGAPYQHRRLQQEFVDEVDQLDGETAAAAAAVAAETTDPAKLGEDDLETYVAEEDEADEEIDDEEDAEEEEELMNGGGLGLHYPTLSEPCSVRHPTEQNPAAELCSWVLRYAGLSLLCLPLLALACMACLPLACLRLAAGAFGKTPLSHRELAWFRRDARAVVVRLDVRNNGGSTGGGLTLARLRQLVGQRVIGAEDKSGERRYPRFSQRVEDTCAGPVWATDTTFSLDDHVREIQPRLRGPADLSAFLASATARPFARDRPLWELQFQAAYGPAGDALLVYRQHPSFADGLSMTRLLSGALCDSPAHDVASTLVTNSAATSAAAAQQPGVTAAGLLEEARCLFLAPSVLLLHYLLGRPDCNPLHGGPQRLARRRRPAQLRASLDARQVWRVRQVTRTSLNDACLLLLTGALRSYNQLLGLPHPPDCRAALAVDLGGGEAAGRLGSRYALSTVRLPVSVEGMLPQLWQLRARLAELRAEARFRAVRLVDSLMFFALPAGLASRAVRLHTDRASCLALCLPGPAGPLWLDGCPVDGVCFWFPASEPVRLSVTFYSYSDSLSVCLSASQSVRCPRLLIHCMRAQAAALSKLLEHRRVPGEGRELAKRNRAARIAAVNNPEASSTSSAALNSRRRSPSPQPGDFSGLGVGGGSDQALAMSSADSLTVASTPRGSRESSEEPHQLEASALLLAAQTASYDDLQLRLAGVQLRLQDPDGLAPDERDLLKAEFHLLMTELRRRKTNRGDGDFDDPEFDRVPAARRKQSLVSLRSFGRRRSTSSQVGLAVVGGSSMEQPNITVFTSRRFETWEYEV